MRFNDGIEVFPGEDPFTPEEVKAEPTYAALRLEEARRKGPISRYVVDVVLPRQKFFADLQGQLVLRNDKFPLEPGSRRQALHFDKPLGDAKKWSPHGVQGLIAFGKGTGVTDVLRPFRQVYRPEVSTFLEHDELASIMEANREFHPVDSYPTGTLLVSRRAFLHGRGETFPGYRMAIDFGVVPKNGFEDWSEWEAL